MSEQGISAIFPTGQLSFAIEQQADERKRAEHEKEQRRLIHKGQVINRECEVGKNEDVLDPLSWLERFYQVTSDDSGVLQPELVEVGAEIFRLASRGLGLSDSVRRKMQGDFDSLVRPYRQGARRGTLDNLVSSLRHGIDRYQNRKHFEETLITLRSKLASKTNPVLARAETEDRLLFKEIESTAREINRVPEEITALADAVATEYVSHETVADNIIESEIKTGNEPLVAVVASFDQVKADIQEALGGRNSQDLVEVLTRHETYLRKIDSQKSLGELFPSLSQMARETPRKWRESKSKRHELFDELLSATLKRKMCLDEINKQKIYREDVGEVIDNIALWQTCHTRLTHLEQAVAESQTANPIDQNQKKVLYASALSDLVSAGIPVTVIDDLIKSKMTSSDLLPYMIDDWLKQSGGAQDMKEGDLEKAAKIANKAMLIFADTVIIVALVAGGITWALDPAAHPHRELTPTPPAIVTVLPTPTATEVSNITSLITPITIRPTEAPRTSMLGLSTNEKKSAISETPVPTLTASQQIETPAPLQTDAPKNKSTPDSTTDEKQSSNSEGQENPFKWPDTVVATAIGGGLGLLIWKQFLSRGQKGKDGRDGKGELKLPKFLEAIAERAQSRPDPLTDSELDMDNFTRSFEGVRRIRDNIIWSVGLLSKSESTYFRQRSAAKFDFKTLSWDNTLPTTTFNYNLHRVKQLGRSSDLCVLQSTVGFAGDAFFVPTPYGLVPAHTSFRGNVLDRKKDGSFCVDMVAKRKYTEISRTTREEIHGQGCEKTATFAPTNRPLSEIYPFSDDGSGGELQPLLGAVDKLPPYVQDFLKELDTHPQTKLVEAEKIFEFVCDNFIYSLDPENGSAYRQALAKGQDAFNNMVFTRRKLKCDGLAYPVIALLRHRGIAARIVNGFVLPPEGTALRGDFAHAWVEYQVDGDVYVNDPKTKQQDEKSVALVSSVSKLFVQLKERRVRAKSIARYNKDHAAQEMGAVNSRLRRILRGHTIEGDKFPEDIVKVEFPNWNRLSRREKPRVIERIERLLHTLDCLNTVLDESGSDRIISMNQMLAMLDEAGVIKEKEVRAKFVQENFKDLAKPAIEGLRAAISDAVRKRLSKYFLRDKFHTDYYSGLNPFFYTVLFSDRFGEQAETVIERSRSLGRPEDLLPELGVLIRQTLAGALTDVPLFFEKRPPPPTIKETVAPDVTINSDEEIVPLSQVLDEALASKGEVAEVLAEMYMTYLDLLGKI